MISLTPEPVRIAECYDDGKDTRHYRFEIMAENSGVERIAPGQFFMLTVPGHGEAPFTYVSLPDDEGFFNALVRKTGDLTAALFKKNTGDVLGYRGALGEPWPLATLKNKNVLCIAGGCGLAPMAALIDRLSYQLNHQCSDESVNSVVLAYGSKNVDTQVLRRERENWQHELPVFEILEKTSATQQKNTWVGNPLTHIDKIIGVSGKEPEVVICCGPEVLMAAAAHNFVARGLSAENIWLSYERRMHCGVGLCGHCYVGHEYVCTQGPVFNWKHIQALVNTQPQLEKSRHTTIRHCGY